MKNLLILSILFFASCSTVKLGNATFQKKKYSSGYSSNYLNKKDVVIEKNVVHFEKKVTSSISFAKTGSDHEIGLVTVKSKYLSSAKPFEKKGLITSHIFNVKKDVNTFVSKVGLNTVRHLSKVKKMDDPVGEKKMHPFVTLGIVAMCVSLFLYLLFFTGVFPGLILGLVFLMPLLLVPFLILTVIGLFKTRSKPEKYFGAEVAIATIVGLSLFLLAALVLDVLILVLFVI